jgi:hypothetical protein
VFTLVFVRESFMELLVAHKAFSRWLVTLLVRVTALEKVVAAVKELVESPRVIEPKEVSTSLATAVLLRVDA